MPRVSVIIPTYNRRKYVQEAIDSVLAQTFTDYEIIVIDDGSTDGTDEALQVRYGDRIHYEWQENQGESVARNRGIELARGEYIAFLDSDDLWLPEKLEKQITLLSSDSELGAVFCQALAIDREGTPLSLPFLGDALTPTDLAVEGLLFRNTVIGPSTLVVAKLVLEQVGGFDSDIRYAEDWDLCLRIRLYRTIDYVKKPLACIRQHTTNQGRLPKREVVGLVLQDHLKLLQRAFDQYEGDAVAIAALRARAFARQYAEAAFNGYARGLYREAQAWLTQAVSLDPEGHDEESLWKHLLGRGCALIELESGLSKTDIDAYISHAQAYWPETLDFSNRQARQLRAALYAEKGYRHYLAQEYAMAARFIRYALQTHPGFFSDVGLLKRFVVAMLKQGRQS